MSETELEVKGRRDICEFTGFKCWASCKKELIKLNLLAYIANRPVLNKIAYGKASLSRHVGKKVHTI